MTVGGQFGGLNVDQGAASEGVEAENTRLRKGRWPT